MILLIVVQSFSAEHIPVDSDDSEKKVLLEVKTRSEASHLLYETKSA